MNKLYTFYVTWDLFTPRGGVYPGRGTVTMSKPAVETLKDLEVMEHSIRLALNPREQFVIRDWNLLPGEPDVCETSTPQDAGDNVVSFLGAKPKRS